MVITDLTPETPEILPCGHPRACVVGEGSVLEYCAWCAYVAELKAEAKLNAQMLARQCDLSREAENEVTKLKEQLRLARMRATSRAGRLPR